jgi:hypothetical protein
MRKKVPDASHFLRRGPPASRTWRRIFLLGPVIHNTLEEMKNAA